jgi:hypothetical protein
MVTPLGYHNTAHDACLYWKILLIGKDLMEFVSKGIYIYSLSSSMWNYHTLNKMYIN